MSKQAPASLDKNLVRVPIEPKAQVVGAQDRVANHVCPVLSHFIDLIISHFSTIFYFLDGICIYIYIK